MRKFVLAHSPLDTFRNLFLSLTRTERLSNPFDFPVVFPGAFGILPPHLTAAGGAQDDAGSELGSDIGEGQINETVDGNQGEGVAGVEVQGGGVDVIGGTLETSTVDAHLSEPTEPIPRRVARPAVDLPRSVRWKGDAFRHEVDGSGGAKGDPNTPEESE